MANLDPWYMKVPLADIGADPLKVQADVKGIVEQYKATKKPIEITDEQLEKFKVDVTAFEDEQGFREVNKEMNKVQEHFVYYNQNKDKYTREERVMLEKNIQDGMVRAKNTADIYKLAKERRDNIIKKIEDEKALSEEDQTIDVDKALSDFNDIVQGEGDVRSKNRAFNKFSFTTKAAPIDFQKTYSEMLKEVTTGQEGWQNVEFDPETGITTTTGEKGITEESLREANKKIIKNYELPQYKKAWEEDKEEGKGRKSFEDWMMKYSPVSLKQTIDKETQKDVKTGTGPTLDKDKNVLWTKPTKDMKDPVYGEAAVGFQSGGSLNLNNLFSKPASAIYLPVTNNTIKPSTGDMEKGYAGAELLSLPIDISLYPVTTKKMKVDIGAIKDPVSVRGLLKKMGIPEGREVFEIPAGKKISEEYLKIIEEINKKAGKKVYQYEYKPFLLMNTQFKGVEVTKEKDEYDIKSFRRTHEVPYEDVKDRLTTLPGFRVYDEEITKKQNELNFTDDPYSEIFF